MKMIDSVSVFVLISLQAVLSATNWPVFFEHLGEIHSIHNKWDLGISVDTRLDEFETRLRNVSITLDVMRPTFQDKEDDESEAEDDNERKINIRSVYETVKNHWDSIAGLYKRRVSELLQRLEDYRALGDKQSFDRYARTRLSKSQFIEVYEDSRIKRRHKRESCQRTSGLFGVLFGFAYQPNIDCLNEQFEKFRGDLNGNVENLSNSQNQISSRHSKEIKETKTMVKKVEKMTGEIEEKMNIMELRSGLGLSGASPVEKTMLSLQQVDAELRECEQHLAEVERVMTSLAGGRLTQSLISAPKLRFHLRKVESSLPHRFSLLYPSRDSLWPYYSVLSTSIYFSKDLDQLVVAVSIPLVDRENKLKLHRVHNLPLKVRNGYSVTADINTEYLITGKNGEYNLPIKKEDFQDCQVFQQKDQQFFCGFGPLLKSKKSPSCVIQLFNVEGDGAMCQSRLTHGLVQPFTRLYNGSWVFAALNQQVPVLMNCPNSSIPTSLLGFGVINLPDGCTLTSDDYYYPHTFNGVSDMQISFKLDPESDMKIETNVMAGEHQNLHQITQNDAAFEKDEPLIISAVEAETEESYDDEYYDETTASTEEYFSEEVTTKVSVETSVNILSNIGPEQVDDLDDDQGSETVEIQNNSILTKDDFISDDNDSASNELTILPESSEESTEIHHDMLVKLQNRLSTSNKWLDNISNNLLREMRRLM